VKFVVHQEELALGLRDVGRAVSGRTTLPILSGILVETGDNHIRLVGTDLELSIETIVSAQVERSGAVVLSEHYLSEIVNRIPGGQMEIDVNAQQHSARLTWGNSEFVIHGSAPEQFPVLPEVNNRLQASFNPESLRELIRQTMFAVSSDESRPMLTGAQFNLKQAEAYAIATDGFRIAYRSDILLDNAKHEEPVSLVIPSRALRELLRILSATDTPGTITVGDSQVAFELDEVRFLSRLLEGEYPHVLELIPREYATSLTLDTQDFHDACERAVLISDSKQRSYAIKLEVSDDQLVITSNAPDVGRAHEELAAEVSGEPVSIAFNGRYLAEGLRQIDTEQVKFDISGTLSPSRLQPVGHDHFFYIVLPMRNA